MDVEKQVAAYYTPGKLEEKIFAALRSAGKNPTQLSVDDLAAIDNFHLGGRISTEDLAAFMGLRPGMRLLDIGCGIGGPARHFAERGCQVTGVDLSEEFVAVAESLSRALKLDGSVTFRVGSALELPFDEGSFDGAYEIHAGMNIQDKPSLFREVARVLKPGGRMSIFDLMQSGPGSLGFPVPWARSSETSFVASADEYRRALEAAGFRIEHQRGRRQFAIEFMEKMAATQQAMATPPPGVQLLMGEQAPLMLKNVLVAIRAGILEPVEIVGVRE